MPQKVQPYIGVCGVSSVEEAKSVLPLFAKNGITINSNFIPMMGFQVSYKSLEHGFSEGNMRVPYLRDLPFILEAVKREVFATIHYYTKKPDSLAEEVAKVLEQNYIYDRNFVQGLQINVSWPPSEQVKKITNTFPDLRIILQISANAMRGVSVSDLTKRVANDYELLDYIIIDPSGGRGIEFDPVYTAEIYKSFRENGITSGIVVAGGLTGDNVKEKIAQLKQSLREREFSIDAEGGLRDKVGDGYGNDVLNLQKVDSYLKGAWEALLLGRVD